MKEEEKKETYLFMGEVFLIQANHKILELLGSSNPFLERIKEKYLFRSLPTDFAAFPHLYGNVLCLKDLK